MASSDLGFRNEVNPPLKVPLPALISPKDKGHTNFGFFFSSFLGIQGNAKASSTLGMVVDDNVETIGGSFC